MVRAAEIDHRPVVPQPREVARVATVQNPYTLGVDPQTGRLYVAGVSTGAVQFVDP